VLSIYFENPTIIQPVTAKQVDIEATIHIKKIIKKLKLSFFKTSSNNLISLNK
jgi:hypothetical protein